MIQHHIIVVDGSTVEVVEPRKAFGSLGYGIISIKDASKSDSQLVGNGDSGISLVDYFPDIGIGDFGEHSAVSRVKSLQGIPVLFVASSRKITDAAAAKQTPSASDMLKSLDDRNLQMALQSMSDTDSQVSPVSPKSNKAEKQVGVGSHSKDPLSEPADQAGPGGAIAAAFEIICHIPVFSKLPVSAQMELAQRSVFSDITAGEYVSFEGEKDDASFIVITGRIALVKTASSGKELVVELLGPNDVMGLMFALDEEINSVSARAQIDSRILWLKTSVLRNVMDANPILYRDFFQSISFALHSAHSFCRGLAHDSVRVRIAALLLGLVEKYARRRKEISSPIVIDITRQQIADLSGTTPETATRMIRGMHLEGVLNCASPGIIRITDLDALKAVAESENA